MEKTYKLIRSRLLLPLSEKLGREIRIEDGYVLIEKKLIKEAGKYSKEIGERILRDYGTDLDVIGADKTTELTEEDIPCLNGVVLPGFVKAHGHENESPIIGVAKDEPLADWLDHAAVVLGSMLYEERETIIKQLGKSPHTITSCKGRLDDVYYGITSCLAHQCNFNKYHVAELVEANTRAGTKMVIAVACLDRNCDPRMRDTPEIALKRINNYLAEFGDRERIRIIPGPGMVFTNTKELLLAMKQWARDHDTLLHIHSSEEPRTTRWFYKQYLNSPVGYLHQLGILDEKVILAHQVNNTPVDLAILAKTGAGVVHNPLANTILGSGMPPIIEMLEEGIRVAIATDGSGSSDNQNMLAAGRLASQYQKAYHQNARLLPAQQILEMLTVVPATMLEMNCGSLETGKDADLILIDLSRPNLTPTRSDNVVENLIWASDGSEVRWVIADGKILKDDYCFVTLDKEEISTDIQNLSEFFIEYKKTCSELRVTGARQETQS